MDVVLDLLSCSNRLLILLRLEICFSGELGSSQGVALHGQIVQDQGINIAEDGQQPFVSHGLNERRSRRKQIRKEDSIVSPHYVFLGEIPIDIVFIMLCKEHVLQIQRAKVAYLLAQRTSWTRLSNACLDAMMSTVEVCIER
jgi:hypothetical protein